MWPVKASLLVPQREFIISRRKKLVPKMELGDYDNKPLVATSGTCSILGCLVAEIPWPPCSTKSWTFNTPERHLQENTGHNT